MRTPGLGNCQVRGPPGCWDPPGFASTRLGDLQGFGNPPRLGEPPVLRPPSLGAPRVLGPPGLRTPMLRDPLSQPLGPPTLSSCRALPGGPSTPLPAGVGASLVHGGAQLGPGGAARLRAVPGWLRASLGFGLFWQVPVLDPSQLRAGEGTVPAVGVQEVPEGGPGGPQARGAAPAPARGLQRRRTLEPAPCPLPGGIQGPAGHQMPPICGDGGGMLRPNWFSWAGGPPSPPQPRLLFPEPLLRV